MGILLEEVWNSVALHSAKLQKKTIRLVSTAFNCNWTLVVVRNYKPLYLGCGHSSDFTIESGISSVTTFDREDND